MSGYCFDVQPFLRVGFEAGFNELLALIGNYALGLGREVYCICFKHDPLIQYSHLAHLISEGFLSEQHLEVDDSDGPDIHFGGNMRLLICDKAFRRKVPVRAHSLRCQLDDILVCRLAQAKVRDFYLPLVEQDVLRFQIVVDNFLWELVKVFNGVDHLLDHHLGLFLRQALVLL